MAYPVNDAYVTTFNYSVNYNLNTKLITITDTSTYINSGGVTGIVFTMTSPNGITGTLTIAANGSGTISMPTLGGGVVYGNGYLITGVLTDTTASYTYSKALQNICKPAQCDGTKNSDGCLATSVSFFCNDNKVVYQDRTSYVYESTNASSITRSVTILDPNNVNKADAANIASLYITPIVNGRYSFTIINTAIYTFSDSVTVTIVYQALNQQYTAACNINFCEFECPMSELKAEIDLIGNDGSAQYAALKKKQSDAESLLVIANIQRECGSADLNTTLAELEALLGVKCGCGCGDTNTNLPICCEQSITFTDGNGISTEQTNAGDTTSVEITNTKPETYLLIADAADTSPAALDAKVQSTNGSITLSYDGATKKENFAISALRSADCLIIQCSFEANEVGTIYVNTGFAYTVTGTWATVSKTLAGTDAGTLTFKNNSGTTMTGGTVSFAASSPVGTNSGVNTVTANNTIAAVGALQITMAKTTAGGRAIVTIQILRT